ncbi:bromodomain-containing protein homolog [Drosophila gunungcola]|uniref:bromodomain-containing protein homolog n=1 Tax=Drosophila gunungcola TaxID=103775 RepID=UPI0022E02B76|nr:bromodomain-containing protein homolog [Drosophila gunungcola]
MGLDFDAVEYCKGVKSQQSQPPFACPVRGCDRSYKTIMGLQYHLMKYDHDNPQPLTPVLTPSRKKARSRSGGHHSTPRPLKEHPTPGAAGSEARNGCSSAGMGGATTGAGGGTVRQYANPESLVAYNEEEATVTFNLDGKSVRLGIDDALPLVEDEEFAALVTRGCILNADAPPLEENAPWARVQVPVARVAEIPDYRVPDAPPRPLAYYRFIEKSLEELDGEVEYDVDEEDSAWLEHMNEERQRMGLNAVGIDTMELLMDRLEKESHFQAAANGTPTGVEVDDDAVCCICLDGECQNTNVILFCDMCNLAVHQDCYGVPYIPEGQWLCRRCLQSPSKPVNCVLCPNAGGAFKQTDHGQWAHVVCALWIPEVRFANTVFLEPIDSIETIPPARWRLTCYVCKEKGLGACIQCHRNSCYAAFHVTCAQQAGLYMTMDTVKDGHNDSSMHVQKFAYCHAHTPADAKLKMNVPDFEDTRHKMREARKALAKKRSTAPVVLIPTIPPDRVQEIATMVTMQRKKEFLDRIIAYWTLKRHYRNGVPLLRRLQSQGNNHGVIQRNGIEGSPDTGELYRQLKYWQCLRQDLERARLLCELVRKREKLKVAFVRISEEVVMLQLNPLEAALSKLLDALEARDSMEIFREPVDTSEVPDYTDIVKQPMDLGTMRTRLKECQYTSLEQLEADFDLMIQNCLAYNNKDTVFYRAGIRMRDQAAPLFVQLRKEMQRDGLLERSQRSHVDHVEAEVEHELRLLLAAPASEDIVQKLLILADKSQVLKNPGYRTKKIKQIRLEITRMRKSLQKARFAARYSSHATQSQSEEEDAAGASPSKKRTRKRLNSSAVDMALANDDEDEEEDSDEDSMGEDNGSKDLLNSTQTPPCSPIKSLNNSSSPVGINRRTAILLTRKSQAALKRPSEPLTTPVKEEHHNSQSSNTQSTSGSSSSAPTAATAASSATGTPNHVLATAPPTVSSGFALTQNSSGGGGVAGGGGGGAPESGAASGVSSSAGAAPGHASLASTAIAMNSKLSAGLGVKSPKRPGRYRRLPEARHSASMSPKKSPNPAVAVSQALPMPDPLPFERIPDSFRVYRANNQRDVSDSDEAPSQSSSPCSSCSDFSMSGSCSDFDSDEASDGDGDADGDADGDGGRSRSEGRESTSQEGTTDAMDLQHASLNHGPGNNGNMAISSSSEGSGGSSSDDDEDEERPLSMRQNKTLKLGPRGTPTPTTMARAASLAASRGRGKRRSNLSESTSSTATPPPLLRRAGKLRSATPNASPLVNSIKARRNTTAVASSMATNNNRSKHGEEGVSSERHNHHSAGQKPTLEPLQLVWAKCRGYPWYPALILDPKTPKGFVYNGVPLPAPPTDVLALRKNCLDEIVFLVLFFDVKRTWQWLPANKLDILGIDKQLDQQKLVESRKPAERKAVKKAYQDALHYQSQVSDLEGQGPDPIM